jgi:transcriptional regulator with AAA-type ATPase domain
VKLKTHKTGRQYTNWKQPLIIAVNCASHHAHAAELRLIFGHVFICLYLSIFFFPNE